MGCSADGFMDAECYCPLFSVHFVVELPRLRVVLGLVALWMGGGD